MKSIFKNTECKITSRDIEKKFKKERCSITSYEFEWINKDQYKWVNEEDRAKIILVFPTDLQCLRFRESMDYLQSFNIDLIDLLFNHVGDFLQAYIDHGKVKIINDGIVMFLNSIDYSSSVAIEQFFTESPYFEEDWNELLDLKK